MAWEVGHDRSLIYRCASVLGPAPDRSGKMELYGWLIGDWEMDAVVFAPDGSKHSGRGDIHFAWALTAAPSRTSGSCRAFSTAPRCVSTIQALTLGTFYGAIRLQAILHAPDRPLARERYRARGKVGKWRHGSLELCRHNAKFISLARRNLTRWRRDVESSG